MACRSSVNRIIIHVRLKSTKVNEKACSALWYVIAQICYYYAPYANHRAQFCYSYMCTGPACRSGDSCVSIHIGRQKPQLAGYTNIWWLKLNLLLAGAVSKPSGFWITSAASDSLAECFILAPTTDTDFQRLRQQTSLWASKHASFMLSSL